MHTDALFFELHLALDCCKISFYLLSQFLKVALNQQFHHVMARYGSTNTVIVAYSGGLDSTVLLHLSAAWVQTQQNVTLKAVHVHHGLHAKADHWAAHCQAFCAQRNIAFCVESVSIKKQARRSLEEQARSARYRVLQKHLPQGGWLLTAHHQDDQAESLLLALKRGSGVRGLAGVHRFGDFAEGKCLRPLLDCSRASLENYARQHELTWINDSSNTDLRFDRNFLRHQILPVLNARWPAWTACVSRSADYCAQQERVLTEFLTEELTRISDQDGALPIEALLPFTSDKRTLLLRHWIETQTGRIPAAGRLAKIWPEVACARGDSNPNLVLGQYAVRRYKNRLFLIEHPLQMCTERLAITVGTLYTLPDKLGTLIIRETTEKPWIRAPRSDEELSIRFHCTAPLRPYKRQGSRRLKKLWQEYEVPPWQRGRVPMLFYNDKCAGIIGLFVCQGFEAESGEQGLAITWDQIYD